MASLRVALRLSLNSSESSTGHGNGQFDGNKSKKRDSSSKDSSSFNAIKKKKKSSTREFREGVRDVISKNVPLQVMKYLKTLLPLMIPSDIVAFRRYVSIFNRDPVLEHFGSVAFKFPSDMLAFVRCIEARETYPSELRDYLVLLYEAAGNCEVNRHCAHALNSLSTGLPQAFTRSNVWQKLLTAPTACEPFIKFSHNSELYSADPDCARAQASLSQVREHLTLNGRNKLVSEVKNAHDYKCLHRGLCSSHSNMVDYRTVGYNSLAAARKIALGKAPNMYKIDMQKTKNHEMKCLFPDAPGVFDLFHPDVFCKIIEEELGVSYPLISMWYCLFKNIDHELLRSAMNTETAIFLEYIAEYNSTTGINPPPKDLVALCRLFLSRDQRAVHPPAVGNGQGNTAADELARLNPNRLYVSPEGR